MTATRRLIILLFEVDNVTHESYILLGRKKHDDMFKTVCSKGSYVSMSSHSDRIITHVGKHTVMYVYRTHTQQHTFEVLALLSEFDELQWVNVNDIVDSMKNNEANESYVTLTNGLKVAKYVAYLLVNT